jgi:hypothetical protein
MLSHQVDHDKSNKMMLRGITVCNLSRFESFLPFLPADFIANTLADMMILSFCSGNCSSAMILHEETVTTIYRDLIKKLMRQESGPDTPSTSSFGFDIAVPTDHSVALIRRYDDGRQVVPVVLFTHGQVMIVVGTRHDHINVILGWVDSARQNPGAIGIHRH